VHVPAPCVSCFTESPLPASDARQRKVLRRAGRVAPWGVAKNGRPDAHTPRTSIQAAKSGRVRLAGSSRKRDLREPTVVWLQDHGQTPPVRGRHPEPQTCPTNLTLPP
jgi:hypothetical protein